MDVADARQTIAAIYHADCPSPWCAVLDEMSKRGAVVLSKRPQSRWWVCEWTVDDLLYQGRGLTHAEAIDDTLENQRAGRPVA